MPGALLLAGCAALGPRIQAPTITIDDVRLDRMESVQAVFVAHVTMANPNDREIAVEALDATLTVEGEQVASASLAAPVTLPAHGSAPAEIAARTGIDAVLRAVASAMTRRGGAPSTPSPALNYELAGEARLAGGLRVPFRRRGEVGSRPRGGP